MMARMTQTQINGAPDPDRSDSGLDAAQTQTPDHTQTQTPDVQTQTPTPTQTQTPDRVQTRLPRILGLGRGRDAAQTPTQTQTPDPDDDHKIGTGPESGLDGTKTQTQTPAPTPAQTGRARRARAWLGGGGYMLALTVVVSIVASLGQKEFAEKKAKFVNQIEIFGIDFSPWFAPAVFDLSVAAFLHNGLRVARQRLSPWPWWICAAGIGAASIVTNAVHEGSEVTAPASAVLFLAWGLYLYCEYRLIVRQREVEDSAAEEFLQTDVLFTVDKRLAERAWLIARTKSIPEALAYRRLQGELQVTPRYVTIRAAEKFLQVYDDQMDVMLNPAAVALVDEDDAAETKTKDKARRRKVHWWNRRARRRAERLAAMTASDEVAKYFGEPVLDRSGVVLNRITYSAPEPTPQPTPALGSTGQPALPPGPGGKPELEEERQRSLPPPGPRVRRNPVPPPPDPEPEILEPGKPKGNAGANWLAMPEIAKVFPGVLGIDPGLVCECNMKKPCGRPLVEHVQRRGKQVVPIMQAVPTWATREERIGKNVVAEVCKLDGSEQQNQIAGLFDHLRKVAQAQTAGVPAVIVAEIEAPQPPDEPPPAGS